MNLRIFPPEEILETTVTRLPQSKSINARALMLAAMTPGAHIPALDPAGRCRDIDVLARALEVREGRADAGESGTALRFLTAFYAATPGCDVELTAAPGLCRRPLSPLVDALRGLGADITYTGEEGRAPLHIRGRRLEGGAVALDATASSQFASALAMIGPGLPGGLRISLGGQIPSMPYLQMTLRMMQARGIDAHTAGYDVIIPEGRYAAVDPETEPDWTAASYWYAIAAASAGWVTLPGLRADSLQGDSVLARIGERFGVLTEFADGNAELSATPDLYSRMDMDMSDYPDLVPALAVVSCLVGLPFVMTGVANLRVKESDRIEALRSNLLRLGVVLGTGPDAIGWEGERVPVTEMPEIDPAGDHRIAMAFAAVAVYIPGIVIRDAEVVDKSYPGFFEDLADAGFTVVDAAEPVPGPQEES